MAASFALNYLANRLAGPKDDTTARDDKPTTVATRGTFVPYLIGRRRVGVVFGWAGNRSSEKEAVSGGGKGLGSSAEQTVWYEAGWHQLVCTPSTRLHKIRKDGKEIFSGTLTPDSSPSGTSFDLGQPGIFSMYWGHPDQPVNTFLGDPSRLGVGSRWPFLSYVEWNKARLGTVPRWALYDYDIECRPISTLTGSPPWIEDTKTLSGKTDPVKTGTPGEIGTAKIVVDGDRSKRYKAGEYLFLSGNSAPDGDYLIFNSVYNPGGYPTVIDETTIFLGQPVPVMNNAGTIEKYDTLPDGGANPAHALAQILLQPYPLGIGLGVGTSNSQIERVDVDSLERLGELLHAEGARCHVFAEKGGEALAAIASILQEFSVLAPLIDGKLTFLGLRDDAVVPVVPADAILPPKPRRRMRLGPSEVTHTVWKFSDAARDWRDNTITLDDDGKVVESNNPKARPVRMDTITHYDTAAAAVERRGQEDLAGAGTVEVVGAREVRLIYPGMAFEADDFDDRLRCLESQTDAKTGRVKLKASIDFIGAAASGSQATETGTGTVALEAVEPDLLFWPIEVPEFVGGSGQVQLIVPRIRAHSQIAGANIWISADNVSYVNAGQHLGIVTGGTLIDPLSATGDYVATQGPTFAALGPDISEVLDLSADPVNWRLGRQLCVFVSAAGVVEITFLQKVTAISGTTYRLDGVIRQRYDTRRAAFAAGDKVFIFEQSDVLTIADPLLQPAAPLYVKSQAFTGESLSLASLFPAFVTLRGKGVTPMPLAQLINAAQDFGYLNLTPGTITFKWQYLSNSVPGTGAGMQNAGAATGVAPVVGNFTVRIKNSGGTTIRTVAGLTADTFDYTQAMFLVDFPAGATSYKVSVEQLSGGLSSGQLEITMTKYP